MRRKEAIRNYKMADSALIQRADSLMNVANRDLTELGEYGVDAATITALETARDAFDDTETDEELMGDMIYATQLKNAKRAELLLQIKQIADRAKIKFGEEDGRYRKFGADMLSRNNDYELVRVGKRVGRVATGFLADLTSEGLTEPMITAMVATKDEFDDLIDDQDDAVRNRDIAVNERIGLGNALYALMVNLAAKGKLCWESVNEAKYNDYVLTSSGGSSGGGSEPSVLEGSVGAGSVVNLSSTGVTPATSFNIENTGAADLKFYFAVNPTDTTGPSVLTVIAGGVLVATATELGYNEAGLITRLMVNNEALVAGSYRVEFG